jgi:hypothetical protein
MEEIQKKITQLIRQASLAEVQKDDDKHRKILRIYKIS